MREILPIIKRIVLYIFLTGATIVMSFPLFWMISSSLKTLEETNSAGSGHAMACRWSLRGTEPDPPA